MTDMEMENKTKLLDASLPANNENITNITAF